MERVMVEIRAAEGGDDAKLLVWEQFTIYAKYAGHHGAAVAVVDERPGLLIFELEGKGVERLFAHEAGGHRWQRVPPTERRGRRHTSTVTVAVLPVPSDSVAMISERDVEWQATRGSGAGGQARNKTSNAVQMRHLSSGISVRVEAERSQAQNRDTAFRLLAARIAHARREELERERTARRRQHGSGQRGDKIRTVRLQDGTVTDHRTGKRTSTTRYMRGFVDDLLEASDV